MLPGWPRIPRGDLSRHYGRMTQQEWGPGRSASTDDKSQGSHASRTDGASQAGEPRRFGAAGQAGQPDGTQSHRGTGTEPGAEAGTGSDGGEDAGPPTGASAGSGGGHRAGQASWGTGGGRDGGWAAGTGRAGGTDRDREGPRLERSRQHKVVAGVCGGLGRHFGMDPVLFRVPLAVLTVIGGLGLLFYAFAWLVMPMEGEEENEGRRLLSGRVEGSSLAAVLCALAGSGLVLTSLDNSRMMTFGLMVAVALGAAAYWSANKRGAESELGGEPRPQAPPEPMAPPAPTGPSWWREPVTSEDYLWGPDGTEFDADGSWVEPAAGGKEPVEEADEEPWRLSLGSGVFVGALGVGSTASAFVWSSQPLGTALVVGLSAALAVFGLGLLVGAFAGRIGGGTIVSIVLTTLLLAGAIALPQDLTTSWSERNWRPAVAEELQPSYRMGSGQGHLDLSDLELAEDETVTTSLRVAAGEARVTVPDTALVEVDLRVGAGGYRLSGARPGADEGTLDGGGFRVSENFTMSPTSGGEGEPQGTIRLTVDIGAGGVNVDRAVAPESEGR